MDEYGQVGPEKPDYTTDVQLITNDLLLGRTVTFRFAAKMTACTVTMARLGPTVVYGQRPVGIGSHGDAIFVAVDDYGACWFPIDGPIHWTGLADHLGLERRGHRFIDWDGSSPFADTINAIVAGMAVEVAP